MSNLFRNCTHPRCPRNHSEHCTPGAGGTVADISGLVSDSCEYVCPARVLEHLVLGEPKELCDECVFAVISAGETGIREYLCACGNRHHFDFDEEPTAEELAAIEAEQEDEPDCYFDETECRECEHFQHCLDVQIVFNGLPGSIVTKDEEV